MCDSRIEIGKARLRSGFALPFALVLTGITLLVIGAGAAHIVSMMNLTREYLSRTRCRLAAQSAIESVKQDVNTAVESYTGGSSVGIVDAVGTHVASSVNGLLNGLTYVTETNIDGCVVHVRCGQATDVVGGVNASIPIYATAELSLGGRTTQVTLQERVCFNMSQSHVFDYAYFANNVGHLEGQMIRINGDVRSNGSFTIDNATINGYVLASGSVTLKNSPKIWAAGKYNTEIHNDSDYDADKYAPVRPTNPPDPSTRLSEWRGGSWRRVR